VSITLLVIAQPDSAATKTIALIGRLLLIAPRAAKAAKPRTHKLGFYVKGC
jgi:hypothetical protein